jgi:hypothetical protein
VVLAREFGWPCGFVGVKAWLPPFVRWPGVLLLTMYEEYRMLKKHGSHQISEEKLLTEVSWEVSRCMKGERGFRKYPLNIELCNNWGIVLSVLV